jgi:hypothetical protein
LPVQLSTHASAGEPAAAAQVVCLPSLGFVSVQRFPAVVQSRGAVSVTCVCLAGLLAGWQSVLRQCQCEDCTILPSLFSRGGLVNQPAVLSYSLWETKTLPALVSAWQYGRLLIYMHASF